MLGPAAGSLLLVAELPPRPGPGTGPARPPDWVRVRSRPSYTWRDLRTVWTSSTPPAVVRDAPRAPHLIGSWALPLLVDGRVATIRGTLTWTGRPVGSGDRLALAVTGSMTVLSVLGLLVLLARRRRSAGSVAPHP